MIKNLLQEGFALKSKGHYKHAIEVFYKAIAEDSSSIELLYEIAELYYLLENEERALNYIEQILTAEPAHIDALKLLKSIFVKKNALVEAEQTAKNIYCITKAPEDLVEIFKLLNRQQKYDEIFEYRINEENSNIYIEQAKALFYKKNYTEAEKLLDKVMLQDTKNQDALLLLAKVYYALNRKDECLSLVPKFHMNGSNPELFNLIGLLEAYRSNYNLALQNFKEAIRLNRFEAMYYFNIANVYFKQGDISNAKKYYNFALNLSPDNPGYHFALANLYYSEKHYKRALEELDGNMFEARLLKAIILYETGYFALANKELSSLHKEQPENSLVTEYKTKVENELGLTKRI